MGKQRINLQNTSAPSGVVERKVTFDSGGATLSGVLYLPDRNESALPALIVTGAWTTVKEQMPGTYAREMAARGFAALAFDFTGWGASEGSPRYVEDPSVKTADIRAAAHFLAGLDLVDEHRISGLGICASSGYMTDAAAESSLFNKVALVAPWLHDPEMVKEIYGGTDATSSLISASQADDAAETVLIAASATDANSVMYQAPYYTEEDRGLIGAYDNKFSLASWKPWLSYDAQASADRLSKPLLMVGSASIALPAGAAAYQARTWAPLERLWLGDDVTQFDFYDRRDAVTASADAVADFLQA